MCSDLSHKLTDNFFSSGGSVKPVGNDANRAEDSALYHKCLPLNQFSCRFQQSSSNETSFCGLVSSDHLGAHRIQQAMLLEGRRGFRYFVYLQPFSCFAPFSFRVLINFTSLLLIRYRSLAFHCEVRFIAVGAMEPITLHVKTAAGGKHAISVTTLDETIAALKERLVPLVGIDATAQRLIFRGHVLKDDWTLQRVKEAHGLEDGHTMHVVRSGRATPSQSAASQTTVQNQPRQNGSGSTASTGSTPSTTPFPAADLGAGNNNMFARQNAGTGNTGDNPSNMYSPFMGMAGRGGAGGDSGLPDMAEMQRMLMQNPDQMQAMLNNPIMDSFMNNPELARTLIMANPQMRELIDRNPEIAHVLNDSSTFRQMMQMARNPSLMNEMMRNTDRQMANIEMMPGGFDALRRMHENIQAPLMDAAAGGFGSMASNGSADRGQNEARNRADAGDDNPFTSLFQPQNNTPSNAPMPNPWAPNRGMPATRPSPSTGIDGTRGSDAPTTAAGIPSDNVFASLFQNANPSGNNNSNVDGSAPDGAAAGFGMGGFPGMPGMPGMANMSQDQMYQMLENPMVQSMMESILSNPGTVDMMIASNPQLQAMVAANPAMANMLRDPAMMRAFLNPSFMRAMLQLRDATGTGSAGTGQTPPPGGNASTATTVPGQATGNAPGVGGNQGWGQQPDMNQLMQMLGGLPAGVGDAGGQPEPEMTQEQLEPQLAQLRDMGFLDTAMCLQALRQSRGNVNLAVEHLLSRFN